MDLPNPTFDREHAACSCVGDLDRRRFLATGALLASLGALATMVVSVLQFVVPLRSQALSTRLRVGRRQDLPPGSVKTFPDEKLIVFSSTQGLHAMSTVCTHLGCIVEDRGDCFFCPCHASTFDRDGKPAAGPAQKPLPWFFIGEDKHGEFYVDFSREVESGTYFEM